MKALLAIAALVVLPAALTAAVAQADCIYPPPPDKLPDGSTATLDDMVNAQKVVKEYDRAVNAYLSCIQLERDGAVAKLGDKPSPEQKKALEDMERVTIQKHNAAVDQDQSVADRFNEQVRVFKAKRDKGKG
jgi:hypothetical protein